MKAITIKCPNCGAGVYVDEGKTRCFCSNCGEPIIIDDEVDKHVNVNISYNKTRERELDQENQKYITVSKRIEAKISRFRKVRKNFFIVGLCCITLCILVAIMVRPKDGNLLACFIGLSILIPTLIATITSALISDETEKLNKLDGLK